MKKNEKFVCCFCGESMNKKDMIIMDIYLGFEEEASQQLFSHRKCFRSRIQKDIPAIFDDDDE